MSTLAVQNQHHSRRGWSTPRRECKGWLRRHPELWIALILVIGSHVFASSFAKIARWQFAFPSYNTIDFCRWDCSWFRSVLDEGYDVAPHRQEGTKANWVDFPLFPLSAELLKRAGVNSTSLALITAAKLEFYAAIVFFLWMLREDLHGIADYFLGGALLAFNPYLIYAHAGYSEPLYFALAALSFYFLRQGRWLSSGFTSGLLSATRMVGCLFALSYVISYWMPRRSKVPADAKLSAIMGLLLCPLGLILYIIYSYYHTGDALSFLHVQIAWGRTIGNPIVVLTHSLQQHQWPRYWGITALLGFAASIWLMKEHRFAMAIFLAGAVVVPLCADTWCMPRYVWWQPPFLYVIFTILKRHPSYVPLYAAFAAGMAAVMVVLWFSGSSIVI